MPSGQSRVNWVTQLRTDGVHCRESDGTWPVNLKVVPNGCCLGRSPWIISYPPLFPALTTDVPATGAGVLACGMLCVSRARCAAVLCVCAMAAAVGGVRVLLCCRCWILKWRISAANRSAFLLYFCRLQADSQICMRRQIHNLRRLNDVLAAWNKQRF